MSVPGCKISATFLPPSCHPEEHSGSPVIPRRAATRDLLLAEIAVDLCLSPTAVEWQAAATVGIRAAALERALARRTGTGMTRMVRPGLAY
jgi:hypothetical protein